MGRKRVLVVGGTGYLGQHLLQHLLSSGSGSGSGSCSESQPQTTSYDLAFTFHSTPPQHPCLSFLLDLATGDGFHSILHSFGQPDVVINCAAKSVPRACEMDPAAAMSINVPSSLVRWLSGFKHRDTLLIHLSTDQVYQGSKSFYKEEDEAAPVNVYGRSKVDAEKFISANCSNFAILRSSIIFGPQTLSPIPKSLPIQWIDKVLSEGNKVNFFYDEFRCPLYVKDVVATILALTEKWFSDGKQMKLLLNLGGPERLSRVQMAKAVAEIRGYDSSLINPVSAATVDRGVMSPCDISMDISKLVETLGILPTPFKDAVKSTLESAASS